MRIIHVFALVLVASTACTGNKPPALPPVKVDAAAANALVPAALKAKFVFAERTETRDALDLKSNKETFTFAAPTSWKRDDMSMIVNLAAPESDGFGMFTGLVLNSNCDGGCEPKDWKAVSDRVELHQILIREDLKIEKDEVGNADHLVVATGNGTTYIVYSWWAVGGSRYYACRAVLDTVDAAAPDPRGATDTVDAAAPDPHGATDALVAACKAVRVD
ncbi:MAG TPA: hypothetical protein VGM90_05420 [Kofleriaceae bacterium]|jgi:hypothetical protein